MVTNENVAPIYIFGRELPKDIVAHGQRVAAMAYNIAVKLNLNEQEKMDVFVAGGIHDYGKILIEDNILRKPGLLTKEEYRKMKLHALYGSQIAKVNRRLAQCGDIILYHHENVDGSGYYGLTDGQIPLLSKIIVVSDIFDALSSHRDYRKAFSVEDTIKIMRDESHKYDKRVFEAFLEIVEKKYKLLQRREEAI